MSLALLPLVLVQTAPVDFQRDVRPILSDRCYACHGPDAAERQARLRFDRLADAVEHGAIVPGDAGASPFVQRITDASDPMPPPELQKPLSAEEIALLTRWIDEGARGAEHWAYSRVERPAVPPGSAGPLDAFVRARLEGSALESSPPASPEALLRRVTLDLTGLPPTLEEQDAFLADPSEEAYAAVVDRLLASPRSAEHLARAWLDAARYGDTHGLHLDNERSLWRYRDWVIRAFERNLPFDRFTIEQLAGDLLPEPTLDQRIATGFHRCNATTGEGGLIAEEYLAHYAVDRVHTTATVWLGTTMACAQCHDHKFDPFTQRDFYRFAAFFAGLAEEASDRNALTPPPNLMAPDEHQARRLDELDHGIAELELRVDAPLPEVDAAQARWESDWRAANAERFVPLEVLGLESAHGAELRLLPDGSILAGGPNPDREVYEVLATCEAEHLTALRLDLVPREETTLGGVGRAANSNIVLSRVEVHRRANPYAAWQEVPLAAAAADHEQPDYPVAAALDEDPETGWAVSARLDGRTALFSFAEPLRREPDDALQLRVRLRHESRHRQHAISCFRLSVTTSDAYAPLVLSPWESIGPFPLTEEDAFAQEFGPEGDLERSREHHGMAWRERPEFTEGVVHALEGGRAATYLGRTLTAPSARELEVALGSDDGVRLWLNGELLLARDVARAVAPAQDRVTLPLRAGENRLLMKITNVGGAFAFVFDPREDGIGPEPLKLVRALEQPVEERDAAARQTIRTTYRREHSSRWAELQGELERARSDRATYVATIPVTMVMAEREQPRETRILMRGRYDRPGERVEPGTPAILPALAPDLEPDRLGLARWLVSRDNPLTARVVVNRMWQHHFGVGLVSTPEDFGSQGAFPSHPELLDWLAAEFMESGWDVRALHRLIVTSETYRQSSRHVPRFAREDAANTLLWRGPRLRLDAEVVRDQALFVAGLLNERVGGPSVKPYQPEGLWVAVAYPSSNTARFERDDGDALWRRSLYTFWKRTSPPPVMTLFDAPSRESCTVSRSRTNTPLQALALMNDVQFVEAARRLAERELELVATDDATRLVRAFRRVTSRRPTAAEQSVLVRFLAEQRTSFATDPDAALALVSVGEAPRTETGDAVELAAWTQVASLLLNLDETISRN